MQNFKDAAKRSGRAVVAGLAVGSALVASSAHAVIDVTAITTAITDAGTAGATVGAAVVVMLVGIKVYKWIRRAL